MTKGVVEQASVAVSSPVTEISEGHPHSTVVAPGAEMAGAVVSLKVMVC